MHPFPAPGIPAKRNRTGHVKGQPPVRASERLKARASQNKNNEKGATANDNYLDIVNGSELEEDDGDDHDFESTKSHVDLDTEENNKVKEERVEAELKEKEVAKQKAIGQQQPALPFSPLLFFVVI